MAACVELSCSLSVFREWTSAEELSLQRRMWRHETHTGRNLIDLNLYLKNLIELAMEDNYSFVFFWFVFVFFYI